MKTVFLVILIGLLYAQESFAQNKTLVCTISRKDFYEFVVVDNENDSTRLSMKLKTYEILGDIGYEFKRVRRIKKDHLGTKEKGKRYLVNSANDTLSFLTNNGIYTHIGENIYTRKQTTEGWIYVDKENKTVAKLNLTWNKNKWFYTIEIAQNFTHAQTLEKIVLLSIARMAYNRSKMKKDNNPNLLLVNNDL